MKFFRERDWYVHMLYSTEPEHGGCCNTSLVEKTSTRAHLVEFDDVVLLRNTTAKPVGRIHPTNFLALYYE